MLIAEGVGTLVLETIPMNRIGKVVSRVVGAGVRVPVDDRQVGDAVDILLVNGHGLPALTIGAAVVRVGAGRGPERVAAVETVLNGGESHMAGAVHHPPVRTGKTARDVQVLRPVHAVDAHLVRRVQDQIANIDLPATAGDLVPDESARGVPHPTVEPTVCRPEVVDQVAGVEDAWIHRIDDDGRSQRLDFILDAFPRCGIQGHIGWAGGARSRCARIAVVGGSALRRVLVIARVERGRIDRAKVARGVHDVDIGRLVLDVVPVDQTVCRVVPFPQSAIE
jgi:hypothetical protein